MGEIDKYNKRLEALRSERAIHMSHYRELSDNFLNYRGRFLVTDRNQSNKRNSKMYNNKPMMSQRTLASGMMAGITSPARPWFRLGAPDPELNEYGSVKNWLHEVQKIMYRVYSSSNVYRSLHSIYSELGVFGISPMGIFEDFENVIHCRPYTVGSYMVAQNGKGMIDTFYREYQLTVAECVKEFGLENCSNEIQRIWQTGNLEAKFDIVHLIEPNDNRDNMSPLARDKQYRSVYYEKNNSGSTDAKYLRRSGFDEFPVLCPRWEVTAEDVYGTSCPAMQALGDTKALQLAEKRKAQAVDRTVSPPLIADAALRTHLQGGIRADKVVYVADKNGIGIKSMYDGYRPDLQAIMQIIQENEQRISTALYEDLFLMISQSDRRQITAREIAEKQEEKLLMLGPVLERLHNELLDPLINRTFNILQRNGVLPEPPQELIDQDINVEYVSVLAQAQRMVAVSGIERFTGFVSQMEAVWPGARHKVNAQQAIDDYANAVGINPKIAQSDDEANEAIEQEQQAAQQAQAMEQAVQAAQVAKEASQASQGVGELLQTSGLG